MIGIIDYDAGNIKSVEKALQYLSLIHILLSRGLGYYGELLISAVFTAVAQLTIGKKES